MSVPTSPEASPLVHRLDSWKQIASYLGRSERTVRRWEEREGLPVHRLQHEQRGSVYAYQAEIDAWWESRKQSIEQAEVAAPETLASAARPRRVWVIAAAGGILVTVALLVFLFRTPPARRPAITAIAVLPFENLSRDPQQEWFSDGMTETLTTELARVQGLRIISRTSAMQYRNAAKPLPQIAAELRVDALVEGSAILVGERVRITVQLIEASTDSHLWSRNYDRDLQDVLGLQREVAQAIAQEIGAKLRPGAAQDVNRQAMAAYLKGLYQFNRGELDQAAELAREGIRIDPEMAQAHELLGMSLIVMADFDQTTYAAIMPEARTALDRALALEPDRGVALSWLGWSDMAARHEWVEAEKKMRRAFELDASTGNNYAYLLAARGRFDEAIRVVNMAMLHDPANPFLLTDSAQMHHYARRYNEAVELYRKALELNPTFRFPQRYLVRTLLVAGRFEEAFEAWLATPEGGRTPELEKTTRELYRKGGWAAIWRAYLARAPKGSMDNRRREIWGLVFLDRRKEVLDLLEEMEPEHDSWMITLMDPLYDPLRSEPRFKALMQRVGYPPSMWQ